MAKTTVVVLQKGATYRDGSGRIFKRGKPEAVTDAEYAELNSTGRFTLLEKPAISKPEPAPVEMKEPSILDGSIPDIEKELVNISDPMQLLVLLAMERQGKTRTGAIKAIEERIRELAQPSGSSTETGAGETKTGGDGLKPEGDTDKSKTGDSSGLTFGD